MAILRAIQNPFSVLVGERLSAGGIWADVAVPSNCSTLTALLLAKGGDRVQFYPQEFTDEFCSIAIEKMSFQTFAKIESLPAIGSNNCHSNTARFVLANLHNDKIQACTGWAFSDEVWRRHSWVLDISTDTIRDDIGRDIYFGSFLTTKACLDIVNEA